METSSEYRRFAQECHRLAREAKTERHRKIMQEMAQAWERLAKETDGEGAHPSPRRHFAPAFGRSPWPARPNQTCAQCNRAARAFGPWRARAISKHPAAQPQHSPGLPH